MKNWLVLVAFAALISCGNNKATGTNPDQLTTMNTLSAAEKKAGWQLLFDGKTKKGWHVFNNKTDGAAWIVSEGMLSLSPMAKDDWQSKSGGDIVTDEVFGDFHLKLEWKLAPKGNSGIMFTVQETSEFEHTYYTGPEMQVLDNNGHPDAKIIKHRAGDLYDLITSTPEMVKPAGEWNAVEIKLQNAQLEFYMNGTRVVQTTLWNEQWKQLVGKSKFQEWTAFGTYKTGRIALQDHGDPVWYRNIKIRKL
jgi:Domain of Unknown Function (DUF1080)